MNKTRAKFAALCLSGICLAALGGQAGPAAATGACPNEQVRTEQHSTFLPDCRAYEMVSPPDKNGGNVIAYGERTRAAADGSAVAFSALTGFGDALGTGIASEYMSIRSTSANPGDNGWSTHGITPPQEALGATAVETESDPLYPGDFSSNLDRAVFQSWSPVNDEDPNVAAIRNLYVRDDLRTPGAGTYKLITSCPRCAEPGGEPLPPPDLESKPVGPFYEGASADFEHVALQAAVNLTADAPDQPEPASCHEGHPEVKNCAVDRAYEWDEGQLRLAGMIPPGSETACGATGPACVPAPVSRLGTAVGSASPLWGRPANVVSSDGSRIFFSVPTDDTGTVRLREEEGGPLRYKTGKLYARVNGVSTVQINASERSPVSDSYRPANFVMASLDGSSVLFTTEQALTTDAPVNSSTKLYEYSFTPDSEGHHLKFLAAEVTAVIGASTDGGYVYFTAGSSTTGDGFYEWHEGQLTAFGSSPLEEGQDEAINGSIKTNKDQARVTPDGLHVLFAAHVGAGFTPEADHGSCPNPRGVSLPPGCRELYLYSATDHRVVCVSCRPSGAAATASATIPVLNGGGSSLSSWHLTNALSEDGTRAFFTTAESLLPEDTNGVSDAYEWEAPGAGSCTESSPEFAVRDGGCIFLLSSGTAKESSYFLEATPDGRDAFFVTSQRLSAWDVDTNYDLYDARLGGGFPEPPPQPAPCAGDSCRSTVAPAPALPEAGSARFSGPGNPTSPRCRKGFHLVRRGAGARCAKRHHRRASAGRRAGR